MMLGSLSEALKSLSVFLMWKKAKQLGRCWKGSSVNGQSFIEPFKSRIFHLAELPPLLLNLRLGSVAQV